MIKASVFIKTLIFALLIPLFGCDKNEPEVGKNPHEQYPTLIGHWFRECQDTQDEIDNEATEEWFFRTDGTCVHLEKNKYGYDKSTYHYSVEPDYTSINGAVGTLKIHLDEYAYWEYTYILDILDVDKLDLIYTGPGSNSFENYIRIHDTDKDGNLIDQNDNQGDDDNNNNDNGDNENDNNDNTDSEAQNIRIKNILCANDGLWVHSFSGSNNHHDGGTYYYTIKDEMIFYPNGEVSLLMTYEYWYPKKMENRNYFLEAFGEYKVDGKYLDCTFTEVRKDGSLYKEWTEGEINYKRFEIDLESLFEEDPEDVELDLISEDGITLSLQQPNNNENQGGDNGNDDYKIPDIGLESYDCYSNSIIAYYRIYNQDKAKVTSAMGYFGAYTPSRSVEATVGGSRITVKFSGLSPNTTYYIKCTATGKGGTGSSETIRLSTTF